MKIACQACGAKYTIADEKVVGKIVKIRCKKCGATIVINGNDPEAATQAYNPGQGQAFDYAAGGGGEPWTVNVADGDQRTMTVQEIVDAYHQGLVNDETFCWKDGMADWLPLREVAELAPLLGGPPPAAMSMAADDEATVAAPGGMGSLFGGGDTQAAGQNGGALFGGGAPPAAASAPAARRAGGRGVGGADLFSGIASAGGEQDVMTSASSAATGGERKMTGERNENSVLFSLSALTQSAPKEEPKTTATTEGSGLIDIRALAGAMGSGGDQKSSKPVDDIMNLGGGGAFSAALAAPVLAPPPAEASGVIAGEPKKGSNLGLILGLVLGGALIVGSAVGVALYFAIKPSDTATPIATATATTAAPTSTSTGTTAATGAATATTSAVAMGGTETTAEPPSTAKPPSTGAAAPTAKPPATGGTSVGAVAAAPTAKPTATSGSSSAGGCPPGDFACELARSAGVKPAATGGGGGGSSAGGAGTAPFDRGAAAAALGAVNLSSCKKEGGPTGSGHVKVTFQPNGTVSTVEVDQPPFQGTSVGGCIAGKYRGVKIPPFSGSPVGVGKSFVLN
jgi:predicted Zn finger-like uncharacterized protein